jgi:hypothetical protein
MTNQPDRELAVFGAARRLPVGERVAYLDETCADDVASRQRVEELLQASEEAGASVKTRWLFRQAEPSPRGKGVHWKYITGIQETQTFLRHFQSAKNI